MKMAGRFERFEEDQNQISVELLKLNRKIEGLEGEIEAYEKQKRTFYDLISKNEDTTKASIYTDQAEKIAQKLRELNTELENLMFQARELSDPVMTEENMNYYSGLGRD